MNTALGSLRRLQLCACLGLALGLSIPAQGDSPDARRTGVERRRPDPPPRPPEVLPVFTCADSGPGSLREAIASAVNGDTIDLTQLSCSLITLTSGEIVVDVANLTVLGPPGGSVAIEASYYSRVFRHSGGGLFTLQNINVTGARGPNAVGGCIRSSGSVYLNHTNVTRCIGYTLNSNEGAFGGGVFAAGAIKMQDSRVSYCQAYSRYQFAKGGGIAAGFGLVMRNSTIARNAAASLHAFGFGGGAIAYGYTDISGSSIYGNLAGDYSPDLHGSVGGIAIINLTNAVSSVISNSTIARNYASNVIGGLYVGGIYSFGPLTLQSSTVASNGALDNGQSGAYVASGMHVYANTVVLSSSIIAKNVAAGSEFDLSGALQTISGSHNLIMGSLISPPGTIVADPQLSGWGNHGGPTPTMALAPTSPAIDAGIDNGLSFDQRGSPYLRVRGAAADIGAFEYQPAFIAPTLAKSFSPDTITVGDVSTLTITLSNPNTSAVTLTAPLTDTFPASIVVADPTNAATTCAAGTVQADIGAAAVTLGTGAAIPPLDTCTLTVAVTATVAGTFTNTIAPGALQTDAGSNSDPASADLMVTEGPPPDRIFADGFDAQ